MKRDLAVTKYLRRGGWSVLRVWEHDLNAGAKIIQRLKAVL
jgi:G:T-mismatch repair DNA endonuclease (very short patch repair protein)